MPVENFRGGVAPVDNLAGLSVASVMVAGVDLHLTLIAPAGRFGSRVDLVVTAPRGTTLADVDRQLLAAVDAAPGCGLHADGQQVPADALLGHPPLLQGSVLVAMAHEGAPWASGDRATGALLELHVTGGPSAGAAHRLGPGQHTVGRGAGIAVDDPDLSRTHARLDVGASGVTAQDLGSANGTRVDGRDAGSAQTLAVGDRLAVGRSTLVLRLPLRGRLPNRLDGDGRVLVNRTVRRPTRHEPRELHVPAVPEPRSRQGFPWLAASLPVAIAIPLAFLFQPWFALIALGSPIMVAGSWVTERRGRRRDHADALARHARATAAIGAEAVARAAAERIERLRAAPDAADVLQHARHLGKHLWHRDRGGDALALAVGSGQVPSRVTIVHPEKDGLPGPREQIPLDDVPLVLDLPAEGGVALCGPGREGLARWVVGQVVGLHSPEDVALLALVVDPSAWSWLVGLPHVVGVVGPGGWALAAEDLERATVAGSGRDEVGVRTVVLLDAAAADLPAVAAVVGDGPASGVHTIVLAERGADVPTAVRCRVELTGEVGSDVRITCPCHGERTGTADRCAPGWAVALGSALRPLRDATPAGRTGQMPARVRLLDLLGLADRVSPADVLDRWGAGGDPVAVLGADAGGPVVVDLRRDGPHVLVAGTTGSGKSELLQTLVTSLALGCSPDRLAFLLVDYKGGSTFADLAALPHVVGSVTDLDGPAAERALASLTAEVRRRERVLAAAGARDLDDLLASGGGPLPRLVVVVDEFRVLAEEVPDVLGDLVRLASVGRSLGIHLVLATQRPSGVVSADIRANTTLRIALRVADDSESRDVIDAPHAARIPVNAAGRAWARSGSAAPMPLQVARVTTTAPDAGPVRVRLASAVSDEDEVTDRDRDLDRAVQACVEAARLAPPSAATRAWRPWLPALPALVGADQGWAAEGWAAEGWAAEPGLAVLGLTDEPWAQRQQKWVLDLATSPHLAVVGGGRSGRTSLLVTLVAGLAAGTDPADLEVHVLHTGDLAGVRGLPHLGTTVDVGEPHRAVRLLDRLDERLAGLRGERATGRATLLLVDGHEAWRDALDAVDHGRGTDVLERLARDGGSSGLRVVVTGDRGLLTSRLAAALPHRVLLRTSDPLDVTLAGVPAREVPRRWPPGRALLVGPVDAGSRTSVEAQVALVDSATTVLARASALARVVHTAGTRWATPDDRLRVDPLPRAVDAADVTHVPGGAAGSLVIGIGGDRVGPLAVALADGPWFAVAGDARSGRSTTLVTLARAALADGLSVVAVGPRPGPLRSLAEVPGFRLVTDPGDASGVLQVDSHGDGREPLLLVDDAELLADSAVEQAVLAVADRARVHAGLVVVAAGLEHLAGGFRGLVPHLRSARHGLVLRPRTAGDGEAVGVRLPASLLDPLAGPGRGVLVGGPEPLLVQVARWAPDVAPPLLLPVHDPCPTP